MKISFAQGDVMRVPLADKSVHCIITSPPYWALRNYDTDEYAELEMGKEPLHDCNGAFTGDSCGECFVCHVRQYAREFWRVLRDDGTFWLNLGDSYASGKGSCKNPGGGKSSLQGHAAKKRAGAYRLNRGNKSDLNKMGLKPKDLCGVPWRTALALQADGWTLRAAPPWIKPNPMPESTKDRPNTAHEYWFMLTKGKKCYSDMEVVKQESTDKLKGKDNPYEAAHREREMRPNKAGRHWRTNDFIRVALESKIRNIKKILNGSGLLLDDNGMPEMLHFNTTGYSGAHFASFNPDMIEPIVQFSTSEHGVCPRCGAPWVRVVKKGYRAPVDEEKIAEMEAKGVPRQKANLYGSDRKGEHYAEDPDKTVGWEPSCMCEAPAPVPAIVLDPFAGTGVTCMVASKLGRIGIGLELSAKYANLARQRTGLRALQAWEGGKQADGDVSGLPLFG
jgi:DNA modification methylase